MKVLSEKRKYTVQDFERFPEGPLYYKFMMKGLTDVVVGILFLSTAYYDLILKKRFTKVQE
jgi:hypothetical protein